ncbi:MAG: type II toxin-antitoxin system Phd/YefM family antitoxin [Sulfuricurvum sp.]|uniref:type II toxin-antitoxin system Phd/YefM family antitoxin n=1 Tax=Sulfuricurvum sp. TaxID=2025608 RepID=UPI002617BCA8|nr:type II toxin-antitoxin system Phd/YefM family antitoxin [Sulfuricurvum sp.]MDD2830119.1 type II toxin-antitoxin system Phd/YefM family antitoxin [Sulfuricurvum sp.]MDD4949617.1 type II toxin-antitoxin system Phd/YefM family antitoxin [Sulfuricurvum sp.]
MQTIEAEKFKNNFFNILHLVQKEGKSFIISHGKNHKKVAMIIPCNPYIENQEERKFGLYKNKGSFRFNNDFCMCEEELLAI